MRDRIQVFLRIVCCCSAMLLSSAMAFAQTEAQSGDDPSLRPSRTPTAWSQHEAPKRMHEDAPVQAKVPALASPIDPQLALRPAIARKLRAASQPAVLHDKDPEAPLLIGFGLLFLIPSLLAIILTFVLVTAPIFLGFALVMYLTFTPLALLGLGLLIAGIIVGITGHKSSTPDEIPAKTDEL